MTITTADLRPSRTILAVVTVGRYSCSSPIIEICRILHERGHTIEFACLEGWQHLATPHKFITKTHVVGRDLTNQEDDDFYRLLDDSGIQTHEERKKTFQGLAFFMKWWPETYANVKRLCESRRPDFLLIDCLADACIDVANQLHIPIASHFPQLPPDILPASYIPGMPGYQLRHLTSEHAGFWDRIMEEIHRIKIMFAAKDFIIETSKMRKAAAVGAAPSLSKPNYLVFVNSFIGLEVPKDFSPLVRPIGPVLQETFLPLSEKKELDDFLHQHHDAKVMYVAFGSHLVTPRWRMRRLIQGINAAMKAGVIDVVIWAMKTVQSDVGEGDPRDLNILDSTLDYNSILNGLDKRWLIQTWVPQRAILSHPSVRLFLSHCGAGSTMEAAFHGVPVIAMPVDADQFGHAKRLVGAGVAIELDKNDFSALELRRSISQIVNDEHDSYARNVLRLQRIAHANSERKFLAAQMIEEVMYDHELRFECSPHGKEWSVNGSESGSKLFIGAGRELRPCHLETCDMRMSWVKRHNLDIWSLSVLLFSVGPLLLSFYSSIGH